METTDLVRLCEGLVERALDSGASAAEAVATWSNAVETTLENNDIHCVQSTDEAIFGLRILIDQRLGFITANATDAATLARCVAEGIAQAKSTPADEFNGLPDATAVSPVEGLYSSEVASIGVEQTTAIAAKLLDHVSRQDSRVRIDSGSVSATTSLAALVSSNGISLSEAATSIDGGLFGMAVDGDEVASFDYDGDACRCLDDIEALLEAAAGRFVEKCLSGLGAGNAKSFKGAVVLSPEAVGEFLLPDLIAAMSADSIRKGRSPLADKLASAIASASLTLIDDGTRPGGIGSSAFDREGVALQRRVLVKAGVLESFLYNSYEARAAGGDVRSSGHASGSASTLPGIAPAQLELEAGDTDVADLVSDGPVIVVGRFSGSTNPVTGDFSGVVKNGALVENGCRRPIKETTIAGNLFEILEQVSAVSRQRRLIGGSTLLPSIRIEGVSVTAG